MRSNLAFLALFFATFSFTPNLSAQCQLQKLKASPSSTVFGEHLSLSGDRLLVGAPLGNGSYIFEKQNGAWIQTAELSVADPTGFAKFGSSVSLSGNRALIGSPNSNANFPGHAYIFEKQAALWKLKAGISGSGGSSFGKAVALDGDVALVGDPGANAVLVFEKQDSPFGGGVYNFVLTSKIQGPLPFQFFGMSLSFSSGRALIGAMGNGSNPGMAYVYEKIAGSWTQTGLLVPNEGTAASYFGYALTIVGDRALIGARGADGAAPSTGAAYLFEKQGPDWVKVAKLFNPLVEAPSAFGSSVALSGNTALIGAPWALAPGVEGAGAVHVFRAQGSSWAQTNKIVASDATYHANLGVSVALAGNDAFAGANYDQWTEGAVYEYWLGPCLEGPAPGISGAFNSLNLSNASANGLVGLLFGLTPGNTPISGICGNQLVLGLSNPLIAAIKYADPSGNLNLGGYVDPSLSGVEISIQGVDASGCGLTPLVVHQFP